MLKQQPDQSFDEFIYEVELLSAQLRNTTSHLNDNAIHAVISANVDKHLHLHAQADLVTGITAYTIWKASLTTANVQWLQLRAMVKSVTRSSKVNIGSKPIGSYTP